MSGETDENNSVIVKQENNFEEKIENKNWKIEDNDNSSDEDEYEKVCIVLQVMIKKMK